MQEKGAVVQTPPSEVQSSCSEYDCQRQDGDPKMNLVKLEP